MKSNFGVFCLFLFVIVSGGYAVDIDIVLGIPFYEDGTGVIVEVLPRSSLKSLFGVNVPVYLKGGVGGQYAFGSDGDYVVNLLKFNLIVGSDYMFRFSKINFGIGVDLGISYGVGFSELGSIGSIGVDVRPSFGISYDISDRFGVFTRFGYNTGIYNFYLGYVYFNLGVSLGL
ncbi:MAG: hypothetical protein N2712_00010 [Brevinematales bacterium]|nr:hypothetical protein [Brevinematales bacterium]